MYQTILVPLDGTLFSERALPLAVMLARATGAKLTLVRAAWSPSTARSSPWSLSCAGAVVTPTAAPTT